MVEHKCRAKRGTGGSLLFPPGLSNILLDGIIGASKFGKWIEQRDSCRCGKKRLMLYRGARFIRGKWK